MSNKEEIIQAAKQKEKESEFTQIVKDAKGVNSSYGIGFLEGAEWADGHLRKGLCDIDKACEWLRNNVVPNGAFSTLAFKEEDIQMLKKAMEE